MFWIHGGVFILQHGGEELHSPDFLITEDVVVVTINYRLGLLGFISSDDTSLDIPGSAGLKDQVMALKWVQEKIDKFGGDPNDVTVFGQSAGAVSVHLMVLSPLAKGLFHKAIAQSGSAINPWVQARKGVKRVAEVMGLEGADDKTVFDAVTKKSKEEILGLQEIMDDNLEPYTPRYIGLVIETNSKEPSMTEEPINIMKSGNFSQVQFLTGCTSLEGATLDLVVKSIDFNLILY
ncbi:venom carboxylesterase-6-like [Zophobas morio]|uniref:venom carboxylesterase-6-like n=1 Tax=Zophobas morio TaxID=2755281 RepID=UPI0030829476